MAFDAYFLTAVLKEIREKTLGARVEKIYQPSRDTVILLLKGQAGRYKLLLAPNPAAPRLYLTQTSPENPQEPPMFCMLLRKHLLGARLEGISQIPMERCVTFTFSCTDELGDPTEKKLTAELMGRTCNLYLLGADGRILDCLRRVGIDGAIKRPALPGLYYQLPEPVEKKNPAALTQGDFLEILNAPGADLLAQRLMDTLGGLSALVCREAALYAAGDTEARLEGADKEALSQSLSDFFSRYLTNPEPWYTPDAQGNPKQFAFCPIHQYGNCQKAESFGELLDRAYVLRERQEAMGQKSQSLRKTLQNLSQRVTRKMAIQEKELAATYDRERLRQLGDILTTNIHRMKKGQTQVEVEDFYDPDMKVITVPLSPLLSPQENAAKYYKDYARMKNAQKELTRQLELGRVEKAYLESVLEELSRADSDAAIEEIRHELQAGGYVRPDAGKKRMKAKKLAPMRFESTSGFPIYVGRNNRQNEELTFQLARKDDLWLHAQKVHGSHVIVSCGGAAPDDDTVTQAAQLAAYYSEARNGQNVPVDATAVKQVKKTPGGKPGMVIYHTYRTVLANPYGEIVVDPLNAQGKCDQKPEKC